MYYIWLCMLMHGGGIGLCGCVWGSHPQWLIGAYSRGLVIGPVDAFIDRCVQIKSILKNAYGFRVGVYILLCIVCHVSFVMHALSGTFVCKNGTSASWKLVSKLYLMQATLSSFLLLHFCSIVALFVFLSDMKTPHLLSNIWGLCCRGRVSPAGMGNCIPQNAEGCKILLFPAWDACFWSNWWYPW